jgi:hypothetical protein
MHTVDSSAVFVVFFIVPLSRAAWMFTMDVYHALLPPLLP